MDAFLGYFSGIEYNKLDATTLKVLKEKLRLVYFRLGDSLSRKAFLGSYNIVTKDDIQEELLLDKLDEILSTEYCVESIIEVITYKIYEYHCELIRKTLFSRNEIKYNLISKLKAWVE
jgi:hypothetical protein